MFQTAVDLSRNEEQLGWTDKTESEQRALIWQDAEYTRFDRALLNRIALALEDIAASLNPQKRKERVRREAEAVASSRWHNRWEKYITIRLGAERDWIEACASSRGEIPHLCLNRLHRHLLRNTYDPWNSFLNSTEAETGPLMAAMMEAVRGCELPDSLCGPKTKTEAAYQAWKNGKPSENSTPEKS